MHAPGAGIGAMPSVSTIGMNDLYGCAAFSQAVQLRQYLIIVGCNSKLRRPFPMDDTTPPFERDGHRFTFVSAAASPVVLALGVAAAIGAAIALATGHFAEAMVIAFFAAIFLANVARRSVLEIDLTTRRLRLTRSCLTLWTRTIVDRRFEECRALGTILYNTDGRYTWTAFFQVENSQRHAIPLPRMAFAETKAFVRDLSAKTGIPFEETPMVEIVQTAS